MKRKLIQYILIFWLIFLLLVIGMGATRHVYTNGKSFQGKSKNVIEFLSSFLYNLQHFDDLNNVMFTSTTYQLKNGFNYSSSYKESKDYILDASWDVKSDQNVVRLIRIHDGKIIHLWKPDIAQINKNFNRTKKYGLQNHLTNKTTRLLHPYLFTDGSIVFGGSRLYKIDKNSKMIWESKTYSHHSIETDLEGNIWTCGFNLNKTIANKYQIKDNTIQKTNAQTGKLIYSKSIFQLLIENGFQRSEIFINPYITKETNYIDYFHLNDIQPTLYDSKYWKKGDLFISLRQQNLVFLYRPSTNKIIWKINGPWLQQHDIDILDDHRISIFGNNVLDAKFPKEDGAFLDKNNIQYIFDFEQNKISTPFNRFFSTSKIKTKTQGLSRILNDSTIFVEETKKGRLLYGNRQQVIWTYINKIDNNHLSQFNWSSYITEDEFKKFTFVK